MFLKKNLPVQHRNVTYHQLLSRRPTTNCTEILMFFNSILISKPDSFSKKMRTSRLQQWGYPYFTIWRTHPPSLFQIGVRFARQQDPLPYMVSQPLPWQVHSVSHSRRSSKADEVTRSVPQCSCCTHIAMLMHRGNWFLTANVTISTFFLRISPAGVAGIFTHILAFLILCYLIVRQRCWKAQQSSLTQHVSI